VTARFVRSAFDNARQIYRTQGSPGAVGRYFLKFAIQRGPQAIRRRIEARRSASRLAMQTPTDGQQIGAGILVGGVVGDSIMAARFLRDMNSAFGDLVFDVYSANVEQSRWIFEGARNIRDHFQDSLFESMAKNYDIALSFSDTVAYRGSRADFLTAFPAPLAAVLTRLKEAAPPETADAESRHRHECILAQDLLFKHSQTRASASQFLAGIEYGGPRYPLSIRDDVLKKYALLGKKYVTVHNGFSLGEVAHNKTSTKSYMKFGEVIKEVRRTRSDLLFVQVGASTSVPIDGTDLNLIGRTTLPEAASLVSKAWSHLDNESGFVTVASCFGTPCCVVYGPTSADYYAYEGNIVVRPVACGGCWWTSKDWMTRCPRGMREPICTNLQPPSAVAQALLQLLDARNR
jgi:hypothetical protein